MDVDGIIPARAGFTRVGTSASAAGSDHPRSRGVYATTPSTTTWKAGSSPLARGLLGRYGGAEREDRIIPARAGFTACNSTKWGHNRDHPRSRGVYALC